MINDGETPSHYRSLNQGEEPWPHPAHYALGMESGAGSEGGGTDAARASE